MASNESLTINFLDESGVFVGWKVEKGRKVLPGNAILVYNVDKKTRTMKSTHVGTILEMANLKEGDPLIKGTFLMNLRKCHHTVVMKDMCADCGENLRTKDGLPGERLVKTEARVAMVHKIPELIITSEEAKKLGAADEDNLLKQRKLVLLVDLDQTLIHTTNEDVDPNLKNTHHFQLYQNTPWYHVRLRPNTVHFLQSMHQLYEMHICTFGARMYAHKIAEIIDPDGSIFGHRILSRDECFDSSLKTANLKALFPCGDRLVCVIDDREDVWNFASNVIQVKPYRYFKNTGDINAPSGFVKTEHNTEKHFQFEHPKTTKEYKKPKAQKTQMVVVEENDEERVLAEVPVEEEDQKLEVDGDEDDDDYLYHLEEILRRIHTAFYQLYDQMSDADRPPDLHSVVPYAKLKVLRNVNLVFSAVIPTNIRADQTVIYNLAKNFGANIQENIVPAGKNGNDVTTHLVAGKWGTDKVKEALALGKIKIVSPQWLWCCAERWERVEEKLFALTKDADYTKLYCNLEGNVRRGVMMKSADVGNENEDGRSYRRHSDEPISIDEPPMKKVANETNVDEEVKDEDNLTKEEKAECVLNDEKEESSISDSTSTEESLGSFDDELAEALEREMEEEPQLKNND